MESLSTVQLSGYSILSSDVSQLKYDSKCIINTVNQYSYIIAENDKEFKNALLNSDVLLPDGVGVTAAVKLINNQSIKKIAGADVHEHFLNKLNAEGGSCFYLGASDATLSKIKEKISREYPNIKVGVYSPPFKASFSDEENVEMISRVNEFKPDVLFVGMTAPKQEKWIYKHKDNLDAGAVCAIGAVFDFFAGTVNRPSKFWQNLGLEWFVRLVNEPKRMYKRYLIYGPAFGMELLKMKVNQLSGKFAPQIPAKLAPQYISQAQLNYNNNKLAA
ncbi:MAG TPA: WecB/TagA/CpsF family glycosyltransferase [Mucilaginibacter sp.]|jgi:N-acetylglucosaminyldiphosphoundecaprenol N-acetyl-beta-D-mannosaminyltransferase|nr:WecB/TagA/CpsF family glycosyltransferase [Mucilaginibacter sp.]